MPIRRPPWWAGLAAAVAAVALATLAIYPLKSVAPTVSLSVVYLPAVLVIAAYWGLTLGLLTSIASAAAFNFFHVPPLGKFTIADSRNWVALVAFILVALVVSTMAELARGRAAEAERRRREADLAATLARELLAGDRTQDALRATARRLAEALGLASATLELGVVPGNERHLALPLAATPAGPPLATLLVPRDAPADTLARLRSQVGPALGALVAVALHRDAAQAEAVETAALRRSDELKTALLRAVSHDLRTPLTAIVTGGHALGSSSLSDEEREQMSAAVVEEGERLSALIDKLFDLSRLQAGRLEPRRESVSIEEVLLAAEDALPAYPARPPVQLAVDPHTPPLVADAAQLERVFANLLENALRYARDQPVRVSVRRVGARVVVRVSDRGPGIPDSEQQRIFEPFYRGTHATHGPGSGLGLAIAKGFVEANGGTIAVESLPGQGTSLVVSFPVEDGAAAPAAGAVRSAAGAAARQPEEETT